MKEYMFNKTFFLQFRPFFDLFDCEHADVEWRRSNSRELLITSITHVAFPRASMQSGGEIKKAVAATIKAHLRSTLTLKNFTAVQNQKRWNVVFC